MAGGQVYKRSAKNYLLDRHFQLKYTGLLVGITVVVSAGLGVLLWRSSVEVVAQSRQAVEQGQETVRRGQTTVALGHEVIRQSKKVSEVVSMTIEKFYGDNKELASVFRGDADAEETKLAEQQKKLEDESAFLRQRATELEQQAAKVEAQQRNLIVGLVAGMLALVVAIGIAGIVFTHKIAGPVYKMKRLFGQIGDGKIALHERLRKGDELVHFFEAFEQMVDRLRQRQKREIAELDEAIKDIEASDKKDEGVKLLRTLRDDMQAQLDA